MVHHFSYHDRYGSAHTVEFIDLGRDQIVEARHRDSDTLDFSAHRGDGLWLQLARTSTQAATDYLMLELSDSQGIENVVGTDELDYILGNDRSNEFFGGAGDDRLYGYRGNDTLHGGLGRDWLYGGDHHDDLFGGEDRDYLFGHDGDDELFGEGGADYLSGGNDNDILDGGYDGHRDTLLGGSDDGRDIFYAQYYERVWGYRRYYYGSFSYYYRSYEDVLREEDAVYDADANDEIRRRYV